MFALDAPSRAWPTICMPEPLPSLIQKLVELSGSAAASALTRNEYWPLVLTMRSPYAPWRAAPVATVVAPLPGAPSNPVRSPVSKPFAKTISV